MKPTKELVLRVNELYHDFEGGLYDEKHDDIFDGERNRWDEIGKEYFSERGGSRILLDVGTGTGFVPLTLAPHLSERDLFICSDISQNILNAAEKNISEKSNACAFRFVKMNGDIFSGIEDASVDFVTVNSVMHHLPDFQSFFAEMDRIVKKGGRVIVGHEPNQSFFRNSFLWKNYEIISYFFNPLKFVYDVVCFFGLISFVKKIFPKKSEAISSEYQMIVKKINESLLADGTIKQPLSEKEVGALIDFQSPTAGDFDVEKGIDMPKLLEQYGRNFSMERYDTYNHVYRISHKNKFLRSYSNFLSRFFPKDGAAFFAVVKKDR